MSVAQLLVHPRQSGSVARVWLVVIVSAWISTAQTSFALPPAKEIWIEHRADDERGGGTLADPFNGNTQELFDDVIKTAEPWTLIHLGVGTFITRGIVLKDGFHLVGRGKELTTIKLADGVQTEDIPLVHVISHWDKPEPLNYIEIRDLTVDANRAGQPSFQRQFSKLTTLGVIMAYVRRARLTDVRGVGAWGGGPEEVFVFTLVHGGGKHPEDRIEILRCEHLNPVSQQAGISGICAFDQEGGTFGGFIRECIVTDTPFGSGVGATGTTDFVIADNYIKDVAMGTNFDTHANARLDIHGNHYDGCLEYGILYNSGYLNSDIRIHDNTIVMAPSATSAAIHVGNTKTSTMIYNNLILQKSDRAPALIVGPNMTGEIRDNVIEETLLTKVDATGPALVIRNNHDATGKSVTLRGTSTNASPATRPK
jgi:hypothetical protein